jgi:hypothetical protein
VVFSSSGASRLWRWRSWNLTGVFGVIRVLRLAKLSVWLIGSHLCGRGWLFCFGLK